MENHRRNIPSPILESHLDTPEIKMGICSSKETKAQNKCDHVQVYLKRGHKTRRKWDQFLKLEEPQCLLVNLKVRGVPRKLHRESGKKNRRRDERKGSVNEEERDNIMKDRETKGFVSMCLYMKPKSVTCSEENTC